MKCSALNVDFNGVRFDSLGSRSPPYERIKFGYPVGIFDKIINVLRTPHVRLMHPPDANLRPRK